MDEQDKEKYHSLKQLSDLSFPAEWHPAARTMQRYAFLYNVKTSNRIIYVNTLMKILLFNGCIIFIVKSLCMLDLQIQGKPIMHFKV